MAECKTYIRDGFQINYGVIEALLKYLASKRSQPSQVPNTYLEVKRLSRKTAMLLIADLMYEVFMQILSESGVSVNMPSRSKSNQIYDPELGRHVLGNKEFTRRLEGRGKVPTVVMLEVLNTIWGALKADLNVTKRGLFYAKSGLYQEQDASDRALDEICCFLRATRSSLKVIAGEGKGFVVGNIQFSDDGDHIDCTRMGLGGKSIPPNMDRVENLSSDALFILLVEKQATYQTLAETRFYRKLRCIIVCAEGQPDLGTREFVRMIDKKFNLPIFGLFDCDPYGLRILSVYQFGSLSMSYDSSNLATPNIRWLGLLPRDLETYKIPEHSLLPMSPGDMKVGEKLLSEEFLKKVPRWRCALESMLQSRKKAELQALNALGLRYLTDTYLPSKLTTMDFL